MNSTWIYAPMSAIVLQIFVLLIYAAIKRIKAVRSNTLNYKVVQNLEYSEMPQDILLAGRSYDNQFQQPILFILLLILLSFNNLSSLAWVVSSWAYVALRYWHCWEHISAYNLKMRTYAFGLSSLLLMTLWICFLISQLI